MTTAHAEGSTRRLLQLCVGYYVFYVITGVAVKYFLKTDPDFPGMSGIEFLVNSTIAANVSVLIVIVALGWIKLRSNRLVQVGPLRVPSELAYIIPSGVCTGIIIPTTTLMYTLPISVMVAMVIMRGSVIVISRVVDAIQICQGILKKRVYAEENIAVLFALGAVATNVFGSGGNAFDFASNTAALAILISYVTAYAFRIYIMNYYKNTRGKDVPHDSKGFFALEQLAASGTLLLMGVIVFNARSWFGWDDFRLDQFDGAIRDLNGFALLAGVPFGIVAFFSVFIFLFKGRTATFAGLVNRLTSLLAGVTATLVFAVVHGGRYPTLKHWASVALIVVAVYFLTRAEKRRAAELAAQA